MNQGCDQRGSKGTVVPGPQLKGMPLKRFYIIHILETCKGCSSISIIWIESQTVCQPSSERMNTNMACNVNINNQ